MAYVFYFFAIVVFLMFCFSIVHRVLFIIGLGLSAKFYRLRTLEYFVCSAVALLMVIFHVFFVLAFPGKLDVAFSACFIPLVMFPRVALSVYYFIGSHRGFLFLLLAGTLTFGVPYCQTLALSCCLLFAGSRLVLHPSYWRELLNAIFRDVDYFEEDDDLIELSTWL